MDAVHLIMEVYGVSDSTSSSVFTIWTDSICCCLLWNCTLWSTSFSVLTYLVTPYTTKRDIEILYGRIKSLTTPLYWSDTQKTSLTVTQPTHTVTVGSRDSGSFFYNSFSPFSAEVWLNICRENHLQNEIHLTNKPYPPNSRKGSEGSRPHKCGATRINRSLFTGNLQWLTGECLKGNL